METLLEILVASAIVVGLIYYQMQLAKRRNWNFEWYAKEFPELVLNGRVTCYRCRASSIGTERLMQHTFLRAHVCRHCGTTLYYSSEN